MKVKSHTSQDGAVALSLFKEGLGLCHCCTIVQVKTNGDPPPHVQSKGVRLANSEKFK